MTTNIFTEPAPPDAGAEPRSLLAALIALLLLALRYLKRKLAPPPDAVSRGEFHLQMRELISRIQTNHLALLDRLDRNHSTLLEKLDKNHRELLAALERQGNRISALEAGFARLDERTK